MIDFAVIGSGISGATISNKLNKNILLKFLKKPKELVEGALLKGLKVT